MLLGDLVADIILPIERFPLRANEHGWAEGLFTELGGGCNSLVAARRMGLRTSVLGAVGGDSYGAEVQQMLASEGVDIRHITTVPDRQTVLCVVVTDRTGQHTFLGIKDDKPQSPTPREWLDVIPQTRSLLTTGYGLRELMRAEDVLEAVGLAVDRGVPVFFDPGPAVALLPPGMLDRALRLATVLLLTLDEAQHLVARGSPGDIAHALLDRGPSVVVVKAGADGCYVADGNQVLHQPGFRIQLVDTVGAGDAFASAFIAGYLRGGSWRDCAALANAMGAAVASTQGAGRRIPPAGRLIDLLAEDPASALVRPEEP
jgi:sugar/nucleoside kinase (ribokinase family)